MKFRIERCSGNEIFEVTSIEYQGIEENGNCAKLKQKPPPFQWIAYPSHPQAFELYYWRHYGPRAFDLRIQCGFFKNDEENKLFSNVTELSELAPIVEDALGSTLSWPIQRTTLILKPIKTDIFMVEKHQESLILLFNIAVSNLKIAREKT